MIFRSSAIRCSLPVWEKLAKRPPRRGHGAIDVGVRTETDLPGNVFGRGIYDVEKTGCDRLDPLPIDVKHGVIAHYSAPVSRAIVPCLSIYTAEYNARTTPLSGAHFPLFIDASPGPYSRYI